MCIFIIIVHEPAPPTLTFCQLSVQCTPSLSFFLNIYRPDLTLLGLIGFLFFSMVSFSKFDRCAHQNWISQSHAFLTSDAAVIPQEEKSPLPWVCWRSAALDIPNSTDASPSVFFPCFSALTAMSAILSTSVDRDNRYDFRWYFLIITVDLRIHIDKKLFLKDVKTIFKTYVLLQLIIKQKINPLKWAYYLK